MLDVLELEPRSGETCLVRHLERAAFRRIREANEELAQQNQTVLKIAEGWLDEFGAGHSSST